MSVNINDKDHNQRKRLTPALYTLLEACLEKRTTNTKILATYLGLSPATIRTEFQRILAFMNVHCRYEALRTAEEKGLIRRKPRAKNVN